VRARSRLIRGPVLTRPAASTPTTWQQSSSRPARTSPGEVRKPERAAGDRAPSRGESTARPELRAAQAQVRDQSGPGSRSSAGPAAMPYQGESSQGAAAWSSWSNPRPELRARSGPEAQPGKEAALSRIEPRPRHLPRRNSGLRLPRCHPRVPPRQQRCHLRSVPLPQHCQHPPLPPTPCKLPAGPHRCPRLEPAKAHSWTRNRGQH
jgi:hypothetical protein